MAKKRIFYALFCQHSANIFRPKNQIRIPRSFSKTRIKTRFQKNQFDTAPENMEQKKSLISFRALSLKHGLCHSYFSTMYRRGQMSGIEIVRVGNKCRIDENCPVTRLVIDSLIKREGRPMRFAPPHNSAALRRKFLARLASGEATASNLDARAAIAVLLLAADFHERRQRGEKARAFVAACEFARDCLIMRRQDDATVPSRLRGVAEQIARYLDPQDE
jgi:hypothetical protein